MALNFELQHACWFLISFYGYHVYYTHWLIIQAARRCIYLIASCNLLLPTIFHYIHFHIISNVKDIYHRHTHQTWHVNSPPLSRTTIWDYIRHFLLISFISFKWFRISSPQWAYIEAIDVILAPWYCILISYIFLSLVFWIYLLACLIIIFTSSSPKQIFDLLGIGIFFDDKIKF